MKLGINIKELLKNWGNLIEVRMHIRNIADVGLTKPNTIYDDARKRSEILAFSKQLEKLVEAMKVSEGGLG